MADDRDKHVSRPRSETLNVLCVDGTDCHDSIAFVRVMRWAGRKRGLTVRNLLSYLPPLGRGQGKEPRTSDGEIQAPATGLERQANPMDSIIDRNKGKLFPVSSERLEKLPMKRICRSLPYRRFRAGTRCDFVLLPHGEVKGEKNKYNDTILGGTKSTRKKSATYNSEFLEYFSLAPGVVNGGTSSAHLDFARRAADCQTTDFLYLSGHGGMSGNVVSEAAHEGDGPGYLKFFSQLNLARLEFLRLAKANLVCPLWIVMASCFSLRKVHCELWARYFAEQSIPVRGILGYRRTSPLSVDCVKLTERFGRHLSRGKTILESWRLAHNRGGLRDRWTAMAFDYAKDDTLDSLIKYKRAPIAPNSQEKAELNFYYGTKGGGMGVGEKVEILPPKALLEVQSKEEGFAYAGAPPGSPPPPPFWCRFLISNVDFTKDKLYSFIKTHQGTWVNNDSWGEVRKPSRMIDIAGKTLNMGFSPDKTYHVGLFPPFSGKFTRGFAVGDEVYFTIVHVRRNYRRQVGFGELFALEQVNGTSPPAAVDYSIEGRDTIRITVPANQGFKAVTFRALFKSKPKEPYLWFWFGVRVHRGGTEIFNHDFDSFTVRYKG